MESDVAEVKQDDADEKAMEAAFAASFEIVAEPVAESPKAEEPVVETKEETKPEEVQATPVTVPPVVTGLSEDQLKLLAAIPELEKRLTQQVDKVAGNYGEIKRLLDATQKAAATPKGAAEFDASADGDYIDREFPELAGGVAAKIQKAVSQLPVGITQEQFEAMYVARREREETEKRNELIATLHKAHPDRFEIQQTPQWAQWFGGLPAHQRESLTNSQDPYYVSGMLSKFKEQRDKQAAEAAKSKKRIENAVTPTGVKPTSPSTITEEEAAQKAFEDQFR